MFKYNSLRNTRIYSFSANTRFKIPESQEGHSYEIPIGDEPLGFKFHSQIVETIRAPGSNGEKASTATNNEKKQ